MKADGALGRTWERLGRGWERTRVFVVSHPWLTAAAIPAAVLLYVIALIPFTPSIGDIRKAKHEQPTIVLSADGKELAVFKRANRDWVKLADISPTAIQALLATEDHRFYDHHGIDVVRTAKAAINTFKGDRQGGSTLTQQLARTIYPEDIGRAPTITRKIKEAITALKIEAVYSKDEILESYLNSVSFLYNAWGIEMAARTYFDKPAKKLNELEAATLVGMLKGTSYYNPVLNPERALQRRNIVLAQMVKHGKLPEARFAALKQQPLKLDFERLPEFNGAAPHMAEHLRRWLFEWADKNDYNIYADGLVVRTTIDSRLQAMANQAVKKQAEALQAVADVEWSRSAIPSYGIDPAAFQANRGKAPAFEYFWNTRKDLVKAFVRESAEYRAAREQGANDAEALERLQADAAFMAALRKQKTTLQAGFLAQDPHTGHIKAWVGSRDYNDDKFDHVQQARRQPGSTFKPFVYGAAFEQGIHPTETLMDSPVDIQIDKNKFWRPGDVGEGPTNQPMTLREGLARSKNTITAQLMMRVGPSRVANLARAMGVRQSKLDEVPSLALGTSPVTLKEMVASFATIANGGNYIEPVLVTRIEDRNGQVLETFAAPVPETALSGHAAMTLLDVMRDVIEEGTAVGLKHRFGITGDVAGKTGTTQDNTDGWFLLMHPHLVAGAWVGFNDSRVAMRSEYWGQGSHNALLVVGDFMRDAFKSKVVDANAAFAAPRQKDLEQPLLQRMGDWFNSVFSTPPAGPDSTVVASPPVRLDPPVLEPAPSTDVTIAPTPLPMPPAPPPMPNLPSVSPNAPVITEPQRVPDYPRALDMPRDSVTVRVMPRAGEPLPNEPLRETPRDAARPSATIPGTQVYVPRPWTPPPTRSAAPATAASATISSTPRASTSTSSPSSTAPAASPAPGTAITGSAPSSAPAPATSTLGAPGQSSGSPSAPLTESSSAPAPSSSPPPEPAAATGSPVGVTE